jgi:hypothetical protein
VFGWSAGLLTKGMNMAVDSTNLAEEVQDLKTQLAVQEATMAGQAATSAATHAGTWSTFLASGVALVAGMALAIAVTAVRR